MSDKSDFKGASQNKNSNQADFAYPLSEDIFQFEKIDFSDVRTIKTLRVHDHVCLIYENDSEKLELMQSVIDRGLGRDEQILVFCEEHDWRKLDKIMHLAPRLGDKVMRPEATFYEKNGLFDREKMFSSLKQSCEQAQAAGFENVIVLNDIGWLTRNCRDEKEIIEYEKRIDREFLPANQIINICLYNRSSFSDELVKNLFALHPFMVKDSVICKNFYYQPAEIKQSEEEIDYLLSNLKVFSQSRQRALHNFSLLSAAFNSFTDGISILSPDLIIKRVNQAMNDWHEPSLPLEGKKCYEAYHGADKPCSPCPTLRCLQTGKKEVEIVPGLEGTPVEFFEVTSYPINDPLTGETLGVLEQVKDVTSQLRAHQELERNELRFRTLANILSYSASSLTDFLDFALAEAIKMTESKIGHFYFYDEEKKEFSRISWSKDVYKECKLAKREAIRSLESTGIWGEVVRQRKPLLINDFQAANPLKKGYPDGHIELKRYLSVPVFQNNKIVAIIGVANKESDYTEMDLFQLRLLMQGVWSVVDKKRMEFELELSEEKYRTTLMSIGDGVIVTDMQGRIVTMNEVAEKLTGWKKDEAVELPIQTIFHIVNEETREEVENPVARVIREGIVIGLANHTILISKTGREIPIADSGAPILNAKGEITGVVLVFQDQTKERLAQQALQKAKKFAEAIIQTIHEPLIVLDDELKVVTANEAFYQAFGEKEENVVGRLIFELKGRQFSNPELRGLLDKILPQNTSINNFEMELDFEDLGKRAVLINARRIYQHSKKTEMILLAINDVTELKRLTDEISKSLKEKSILLSEIHHRVKNNLNLVISLLGIQSRNIRSKEDAVDALKKSQDRIYSMSLIHSKLYQSQDFSHVSMKSFFDDLLARIRKAYEIEGRIKIQFESQNITLGIDRAVPLAIIVNELITNAIKHAFPKGRSGKIKISLQKKGKNVIFNCKDNGIGLPKYARFDDPESLGLHLVKILTEQLDGKLVVKREDGTQFQIIFSGEQK